MSKEKAATVNANGKEGYHRFRNEAGEKYGSFRVEWFFASAEMERGWYWCAMFPGCMPDSDWHGPFRTSLLAYRDAQAGA